MNIADHYIGTSIMWFVVGVLCLIWGDVLWGHAPLSSWLVLGGGIAVVIRIFEIEGMA